MNNNLPNTKALAVAAGVSKFFTGKPCRNGHIAYRYVQSGTCSQCIRTSVDAANSGDRIDSSDASTKRAARKAASEQLVEVKVRSRPEAIAQIRALAGTMVTLRFPDLAKDDAWSTKPGTDAAGETLLYRFYLHSDDVPFIRAQAEITMRSSTVNVAAERRRIFGIAELEQADEPPFKP